MKKDISGRPNLSFKPTNVRAGIQMPKSTSPQRTLQSKLPAARPPIAKPPVFRVVSETMIRLPGLNGMQPRQGTGQRQLLPLASAPFRTAKISAPKAPFMPVMRPALGIPRVTDPPIRSHGSSANGLPVQRRIAGASNMIGVANNTAISNYYRGLNNDHRAQFRTRLASGTDYTLGQITNWLRPNETLVGEFTRNGQTIRIYGRGGRYDSHISGAEALDYFRQFANEIVVGGENSLKVGVGRTRGYAKYGCIKYSFDGVQIHYWHAHDDGTPMG